MPPNPPNPPMRPPKPPKLLIPRELVEPREVEDEPAGPPMSVNCRSAERPIWPDWVLPGCDVKLLEELPDCDDPLPLDPLLVDPPVVGRLLEEPLLMLPPELLPKPPLELPPNPPLDEPPPVPWAKAGEALRAAANATPVRERATWRIENR